MYLNSDGTTTIGYKIGKNQQLGEELAKFLKGTIDPNEFESVSFSIKGVLSEHIGPILDELSTCKNGGDTEEFDVDVAQDDSREKRVKVTSNEHQDALTVTHYKEYKHTTDPREAFVYL